MADPLDGPASSQRDRQGALAEIRFNSVVDPDLTPSEDETPEEKALQLENVQSAIGVSIGQQQTRLTSPKTPAAEKAAALDETDGGGLFDVWQHPPEQTIEQSGPQPSPYDGQIDERDPHVEDAVKESAASHEPPARLPSPWRASPKTFKKVDDHRLAMRDALTTKTRRRTLSGGGATDLFRKYIPSNLPSMPKTSGLLNFSLPSFSVSSFDHVALDRRRRVMSPQSPMSDGITQHDGSAQSKIERPGTASPRSPLQHPSTAPLPQREFGPDADGDSSPEALCEDVQPRAVPKLRQSTSEGSLLLYRSPSFTSSLGDDSRFENVQEQVNSRLKAIKDSWQDANFKFPIPSMPNFGFGSRDDLVKPKLGSLTPRGTNGDTGNSLRVSFLANSSGPSSRRNSIRPQKARGSSSDLAGMTAASAATHPYFTRALQDLEGDLVLLGGYRGSILRSAEPPNRQLWVPLKVGLNLRKVDLEVGLDPEDEETMEERIIPGGMLTNIGPVDIAKRLFKRLRASENARNGTVRVHNYGYDWRLSPHLLSQRLIKYLEALPCNQPGVPPEKRGAIVIAHSLGGLITRHAINQRPELVSGVIYAGVPHTCVNILGPMRNGDDVLLSSRVLTAQVNFTIRTSYALLPLDGKCFFNKHTKEEYPVDFFDAKTWEEYRLSPCIAPPLPAPDRSATNMTVSGLLNAMSQALPSLPSRKGSVSKGSPVRDTAQTAVNKATESSAQTSGFEPKMHPDHPTSPTVTIPHDKAVVYLARTLAEVKRFKEETAHNPAHTASNAYPPIALIYGKSTPTVYGAKVESREAIKRADAYDELAFASGDGVVLARAAMVPEGYSVVRGGVVPSERGHVTLLGDLEAVGRCLHAVIGARKNGVGLGEAAMKGREQRNRDKERA
ncbi:hypothetical protein BU26DRAFT_344747 [Trematosphaeria pertusa]|uniref:Uncharacterized protein n=1 Tax=Trematosphaeria pertusa TaxID=390896 RepID=A0A6A6IAZ9_9PLEO|nr:uncharacterized protein BU26DRAFT_344747 [Trematosphaeria pertusa]KAF2247238.1 hypothetical protein BU26DRAFT_344747 [Trematosphaeria pertusa]